MSLYFIMGPGGMMSFGHAAFFGGGAYAAALDGSLSADADGTGPIYGALVNRTIGTYNRLVLRAFVRCLPRDAHPGVCPDMLVDRFSVGWLYRRRRWYFKYLALGVGCRNKLVFYYLTMVLCLGGIIALRYIIFAPFGYTMRACRDSALRAGTLGINAYKYQWAAFAVAGGFTGLAGGIYVFSKGSVFPDEMALTRSFEFLLMVLLGGVDAIMGPIVGPAAFIWLHDTISRIDFWQFILGIVFIVLVVAFPTGNSRFFRVNDSGAIFQNDHYQKG